MSKEATLRRPEPACQLTTEEQLRAGREIMRLEAVAIWKLSDRLGRSYCDALRLLYGCRGSVIVTGMGKAGIVGQKFAASLASLGTRAHFMHPAEAFHGDLGCIGSDDVVVMLTQSGETGEVVQAAAVDPRVRRAIGVDHRQPHQHRRPGVGGSRRAGPAGRGLLAGPGAEHQHNGDAGHRRRAGAGAEQDAWLPGRGFCPVPSGRGVGAAARPRGRHHAAVGRMPQGPPEPDRARGDRGLWQAGPAHGGRSCSPTTRAS